MILSYRGKTDKLCSISLTEDFLCQGIATDASIKRIRFHTLVGVNTKVFVEESVTFE